MHILWITNGNLLFNAHLSQKHVLQSCAKALGLFRAIVQNQRSDILLLSLVQFNDLMYMSHQYMLTVFNFPSWSQEFSFLDSCGLLRECGRANFKNVLVTFILKLYRTYRKKI
jgi:hypothetical protein